MARRVTSYTARHSSKLCWTRKRNTAKNTSRKTTSLTAGIDWLPSMRWLILMSCTVNTNERIPQPMGRMAFSHAP